MNGTEQDEMPTPMPKPSPAVTATSCCSVCAHLDSTPSDNPRSPR
jgi:hypothetical protein